MVGRRVAGTGAAYALLLVLRTVIRVLGSNVDIAWTYTVMLSPVWPGLLLALAAVGRATRSLAGAAAVLALLQAAAVGWIFRPVQLETSLQVAPLVVAGLVSLLMRRCDRDRAMSPRPMASSIS